MSRRVLIQCAAVLLAAFLGLAITDNARLWRRLQAEYLELERQEIRSRLDTARSDSAKSATAKSATAKGSAAGRLDELQAQIQAEEAALVERRDETDQLEHDLERFRVKLQEAKRRQQRLASRPNRPTSSEEPGALAGERRQARMEVESLHELVEDREGKLAAVRGELEAARERWEKEREPIVDLEKRLKALGGSRLGPLTGLISPRIAVRQVRLADFPEPGGAASLDRCTTCHLGADREGPGVSRPRVFHSHPRLELYLGAASPHPHERFGCTTCHGGEGRATDFSRAGHLPRDPEQETAWQEAWGWRREALPPRPMLPLDSTEAACGRCHGAEVWTPHAPVLDAGRQLIAGLGCTGCHATDHPALSELPQAGPSLIGVAGKTRPAWAHYWLDAPRAASPATAIPHSFAHDDPGDGDSDRRSAEIRAVVHYLWEHSRPAAYEPPPTGDEEAGKALFHSVGCAACHLIDPAAPAPPDRERRHGPHLARIGSKVTAGWLQAWLRDPHAYRHDTPMPSLRLDETEAADLTAYLMTRRDPAWENLELPAIDEAARDALVLSHLEESRTLEASQARLDGMSDREKNTYLGERTITRYGCHGCHEIAGFEAAPAVGRALATSRRGRANETSHPRRFSASHRPEYRLSVAETRAVNVALIGLTGEWSTKSDERLAQSGERATALAAGAPSDGPLQLPRLSPDRGPGAGAAGRPGVSARLDPRGGTFEVVLAVCLPRRARALHGAALARGTDAELPVERRREQRAGALLRGTRRPGSVHQRRGGRKPTRRRGADRGRRRQGGFRNVAVRRLPSCRRGSGPGSRGARAGLRPGPRAAAPGLGRGLDPPPRAVAA